MVPSTGILPPDFIVTMPTVAISSAGISFFPVFVFMTACSGANSVGCLMAFLVLFSVLTFRKEPRAKSRVTAAASQY